MLDARVCGRGAWRREVAKGDVTIVRDIDDLVMGFQHRTDAERLLRQEPSLRFSLQRHLHEDIGTAIGRWRKALRFHVAKANRFV